MVVIVIVGVVVAFSVPKFGKTMNQQRLIRAAGSVQGEMRLAFTMAQRTRKPVRIVYSSDSLALTVTNRSQNRVYGRVALGTKAGTNNDGMGLSAGQITVYPTSGLVEVYPSGFASDSMSLTLTGASNSGLTPKTVRMTRAGMVVVE